MGSNKIQGEEEATGVILSLLASFIFLLIPIALLSMGIVSPLFEIIILIGLSSGSFVLLGVGLTKAGKRSLGGDNRYDLLHTLHYVCDHLPFPIKYRAFSPSFNCRYGDLSYRLYSRAYWTISYIKRPTQFSKLCDDKATS